MAWEVGHSSVLSFSSIATHGHLIAAAGSDGCVIRDMKTDKWTSITLPCSKDQSARVVFLRHHLIAIARPRSICVYDVGRKCDVMADQDRVHLVAPFVGSCLPNGINSSRHGTRAVSRSATAEKTHQYILRIGESAKDSD